MKSFDKGQCPSDNYQFSNRVKKVHFLLSRKKYALFDKLTLKSYKL